LYGKEILQAHTPEGEEEYESTDPDTGIKTWKTRKIVRPADKPHKVVDPLHPYTELSGGFVQGEKQYNLIDSEQNTLGQTPGKHDKEVKPSNTSPIKSPEVADPEKETLPRPDSLDKPKPGDYGHKRGPQETRGNVHGFFKKMMNITKPIPDSKGGKGSFQHCINANQDKHNPGGWCKQIERKVEGKSKAGELPVFFKDEDKKRGRKPDTADKDKEIKEIQRKIDVLSHPYTDDDPERFPGGQRKKPHHSNRLTGTPAKQDTELGPDKSGRGVQISDDERKRRMAVRLESRARTGKPYKQTFEKTPDTKPGAAYSLTPGGDAQRREPPEVRKKKRRAKQTWRDSRKTDYFVEEIRANIIYENKIAPLIGMLAGGVARAVGGIGKKVVQAGVEMAKPQQGEEEE